MTPYIFTASIIALAALSAWYDSVKINNGHEIIHAPRWLVRAALAFQPIDGRTVKFAEGVWRIDKDCDILAPNTPPRPLLRMHTWGAFSFLPLTDEALYQATPLDRPADRPTCGAWLTGEWVLLLGSWGLFNVVFRPLLNHWRGLSVWYISPSNWYDWQFLKSTWFTMDGHITTQQHAIVYHRKVYHGGPNYTAAVLRAGKLAYIVELAAFGVAVCLSL